MDQQQSQQVEQQLRQNWRQIRYRILDQFGQVSTSDLDSAVSVTDLVQRISDKSDYSERYVETRIQELVGAGATTGGGSGGHMGTPFSQSSAQTGGQTHQSGQPFSSSAGQTPMS